MTEDQKRASFYHTFPWERFTELFQRAGILSQDLQVCEERCEAMLALTAIHDIFKNEALTPVVQQGHEFEGFTEGEVIRDHDLALNYILHFFADALPSFSGLNTEQRKVVSFTQGKMAFNNGWLVQGEAPPSALFLTFKKLIVGGSASKEDVSFYFVHWLTDLAGAVPNGRGSEQFVLKFPDYVLAAFLRSFGYVWALATQSETEVNEGYLTASWLERFQDLPVPVDEDAVAIMRISLQAQRNSREAVVAYQALEDRDKNILAFEMSRTGIVDQAYSTDKGNLSRSLHNVGKVQVPAFLVYYGPAMLQNNIRLQPLHCLKALAEVYRAARSLWPLRLAPSPQAAGDDSESTNVPESTSEGPSVVTIFIEQLKEYITKRETLGRFDGYFLLKKNDQEAVVEIRNISEVNEWNQKAGLPDEQKYRWLHM
eukprot:gnl/TRDRNA2_/TRDRNA2_125543_c0_seq2.p1 gnl/TRDRNA2_/TRDRNA2_125543_c0~~gnl/TRDRNA2_/TRDRNA2_125543_c0_seq2.p1  ORF type:complete len:457 (-),score=112.94 gnl/TRDRNA2_/TRDRNA2_125543_c0_seq2:50-1330(-)